MNDPDYPPPAEPITLADFHLAGSALAGARAQDVPTYAPSLFAEALASYDAAEDGARGSDAAEVREHLALTIELLDEAAERAERSREMLSDLVRTRTAIQRGSSERYFAPRIVTQAEDAYRLALQAAEEGAFETAERHAESARQGFQEAALEAVELGQVAVMEYQLAAAEGAVPRAKLREATDIAADLRSALSDSRRGNMTLAELRGRIGVGRGLISGLLAVAPGLVLDPDYYPPPGTVLDPETVGPPNPPLTMRIKRRTANSLTVTWLDRSGVDVVNKLERQEGDGPWEMAAEFGTLNGWTDYTDTGLQPDMRYCYRVRVESPYGMSFTPNEKRACGYTRDGNSLRVWRVQLMIRAANVTNAGTENDLQVRLNSPLATYSPSSNHTWLDYGPRPRLVSAPSSPAEIVWIEDFDRGQAFTYDLDLTTISELSDITMLTLKKEGTDALGIAEISLLVNNVEVFTKSFGETSSTCLWIDNGDGYSPIYTIYLPELRAHPAWQAVIAAPPFPPLQISNAEIVSRLEGMIGNAIHGTELFWNKYRYFGSGFVGGDPFWMMRH